jgi:hypothetical protein
MTWFADKLGPKPNGEGSPPPARTAGPAAATQKASQSRPSPQAKGAATKAEPEKKKKGWF